MTIFFIVDNKLIYDNIQKKRVSLIMIGLHAVETQCIPYMVSHCFK